MKGLNEPRADPGNGIGLTCCALMVLFSGIAWFYQVRENKIREAGGRDHRLDGLSPDEVALLGSRHPGASPLLLLTLLTLRQNSDTRTERESDDGVDCCIL